MRTHLHQYAHTNMKNPLQKEKLIISIANINWKTKWPWVHTPVTQKGVTEYRHLSQPICKVSLTAISFVCSLKRWEIYSKAIQKTMKINCFNSANSWVGWVLGSVSSIHKIKGGGTCLQLQHEKGRGMCLYVDMWTCMLVCVGACGVRQRARTLLSWRYRWLWAVWHGFWDLNSDPLGEQQVLLTTQPSL